MGNYGRELKEDAMKTMIKLVREANGDGVSRQTLADAVGVSASCVGNWMSEAMHRHPEIVKPHGHGSKVGYRWVEDNAGKPESSEQKALKEAIIDFLKKRSPAGCTSTDIAKAVGVSRCTVLRKLHEIAEDHIELNLAQHGSSRGYIWTEVVDKPSDEIDPNDLEAIQAAFGVKTADSQKNLPEFGWKENDITTERENDVTTEREKVIVEDNEKHTKNHEGYHDPTAAAAIANTEKNSVSENSERISELPDELRGQIWAVPRQYGGEDYFAVLMSSPHHVCGVVLRYDNDGHYFKPAQSFVYEEGGAQWVGNTSRIYTKPRKFLERYVGDLTPEQLSALTSMVAKSLHIGTAIAAEPEDTSLANQVTALQVELDEAQNRLKYYESAIKKLTEQNESLKATNAESLDTISTLQQTVNNLVDNDLEEKVRILQLHAQIDQATIRAYEFAMRCFGKGMN